MDFFQLGGGDFQNSVFSGKEVPKQSCFAKAVTTFEIAVAEGGESGNSGGFVLRSAGTSNAGKIVPSSLEASTSDLADEFTNMIITQRAYSASTRVITTADDMLDELIRIKR